MKTNLVLLIGNVGSDPEIRHTENSTVANFSLATTESWKNREGERVDQTEWHKIVVWGNQAEVVEKYVKKGSMLGIQGKIKTRSWEDKEGNKRYITEIVCDSFKFLGNKEERAQEDKPEVKPEVKPEPVDDNNDDGELPENDDLPF